MTELDIYDLNSYSYFLAPIRLVGGKMFMWYSICSKHRSHAPECDLCARGTWYEVDRKMIEDESDPEGHNDG